MMFKMKIGETDIHYQFYAVDEKGSFRFGLAYPRSALAVKLTAKQKMILKDGFKSMVYKWNELEQTHANHN
mgnify:FL=1